MVCAHRDELVEVAAEYVRFAGRLHAERRGGLTDETIVMDRTVCGTRDNDRTKPLTCDKYLPRVLPPGGRLRFEPGGTIKVYEARSDQ